MRPFLLILLLSIFATSCATNKAPVEKIDEVVVSEPVKIETPVLVSDVFNHESSLEWVEKLKDAANCTIKKESFAKRLSAVVSFDYSEDSGEDVYNKLINHRCTIRTYRTKNPWSKVYATTYRSNTKDLYLNTRKNPRSPMSKMINTVIHECAHNAGYSHGDNNSKGKEGSVNYKVGKIAELESKGCY